MKSTYIHGTEPGEQQRLVSLNRLTNTEFIRFLHITSGIRALDVGCGLGILAAEVAAAAQDVTVFGLERSAQQIAAAVSDACVSYVRGDAHALGFADCSFDLVYARYLLEHVVEPSGVLREMRRVTRPNGRVAVCENDISLLRLDPPCPVFEHVWLAFQRYQTTLGGDGLIGRRLYRLYRSAGFSRIELSTQPEVHWYGSPRFAGWIQNIIGNVDSARGGLVSSGLCDEAQLAEAVAELEALSQNPDSSCHFMWNRAMASR